MIITYYRCCCCGIRLEIRDKTKLFCDSCSVIEKDEKERRLFEKVFRVKLEDLRNWEKRKAFLRTWDDFDLSFKSGIREKNVRG